MALKALFKSIADAIRAQKGTTQKIKATNFPAEIAGLQSGGSADDLLVDGSLRYFVNKNAKKIWKYRFYQFAELTSANFKGATEIGDYACYQCTKLADVAFDNNTTSIGAYAFQGCNKITALTLPASITNIGNYAFQNVNNADLAFVFEPSAKCDVGQYAFQNTKLTSIKGEIGTMGSYAFAGNSTTLTEIDIKANGGIGTYAFQNAYKVSSLKIAGKVSGTLGDYAFSAVGAQRETPENNVFELDFSTGSFTTVGQYAFGTSSSSNKNQYYKVRFPKMLLTINAYAFRYSDNMELYFTGETPATLNSNAFSNATNYKIFVPYTAINAYKNATNWAAQVANMVGYAPANQFIQGRKLPEYNVEGYALTWFSDKECTNQITTVEDASAELYCTASTERVAVGIRSVYANQADLIITDGTNVYQQGDGVLVGTEITITATPTAEGLTPYQFTLNGEAIESGATFTVGQDDIKVIAIYWDGINVPANPIFAENDWHIIKAVAQAGVASDLGWAVGDTKEILIEGVAYNIRIADMQLGRYNYTNSTKTTNMVFELVEILSTTRRMNATSTNVGGWAESELRKTLNGLDGGQANILSTLPADLQEVLEDVQIKSADTGATGYTITESSNKLFLLSYAEVFNATSSQYLLEGSRYDYYIQNGTDADRVKKRNNSAAGWWLRSPYSGYTSNFNYVYSIGNSNSVSASSGSGVSFGFAF